MVTRCSSYMVFINLMFIISYVHGLFDHNIWCSINLMFIIFVGSWVGGKRYEKKWARVNHTWSSRLFSRVTTFYLFLTPSSIGWRMMPWKGKWYTFLTFVPNLLMVCVINWLGYDKVNQLLSPVNFWHMILEFFLVGYNITLM